MCVCVCGGGVHVGGVGVLMCRRVLERKFLLICFGAHEVRFLKA